MIIPCRKVCNLLFWEQAAKIKQAFYGNRIVMFAPLYLSNYCVNGCIYCPYHRQNHHIPRRKLTQEEVAKEVIALQDMGHKRLAIEAGEDPVNNPIEYILDCIKTIYSIQHKNGAIRRVNVNIAATTVENYRKLHDVEIGTYQLFQETYHRDTYAAVHLSGKKRDFDWRATGLDRAMRAGIDDVGMGVLFGLHDWRFEILSLMQHIAHLEDVFGVGCHTLSVPRMEPADGAEVSINPPAPVSDDDFRKIIAILRLAAGESVGTLLVAQTQPLAARKQWLADHLQLAGRLMLDAGAVDALRAGKSLLPIGVTAVEGDFERGAAVACIDPTGQEIARGLSNYGSGESRLIARKSTGEIEELLGYVDEPEIIHRDNLILIG